ncbi:MAG: hypothetical protein RL130_431 [Actinomycetota bacterium]|jgi:hypothetical protein
MRRFLAGITLSSLILFAITVFPSSASPTVKQGVKCSVQNAVISQSGQRFKCVLKNKKLQWAKYQLAAERISPEPEISKIGLLEKSYKGYFDEDLTFFKNSETDSKSALSLDIQEPHGGKYQFSKEWTGFFLPPESGNWTFTVTSDDSSYLWIGEGAESSGKASNALIALPGVHGPWTKYVSVYLKSGNAYPIRIVYGNDINFAQMTVTTTSPSGVSSTSLQENFRYSTDTKNPEYEALGINYFYKNKNARYPVISNIWLGMSRDSTAIRIQEILDAARLNTKKFSGEVTWAFQGDTRPEVESATKLGLTNAIDFYTQLGFKTTSAIVINGRDMEWTKTQLRKFDCAFQGLPNFPGFYLPRTCAGGHGAITIPHWEVANVGAIDSIEFNTGLPHEYFHQIQEELSGQLGNGPFPLWFWEGGATFFSSLSFSTWNPGRYYEQWYQSMYDKGQNNDELKQCSSVLVFEMSNSESGSTRRCGYSKGALVVEYLVSKVGPEGYGAIISSIGEGKHTSFKDAFEAVTSISLTSFYEDTEIFLKSRKWG